MTSFIDDSGNALQYDGDDFTITKQAASVINFQIKGDVSVNFKLDNNPSNRNALGYYGPQQISSPVLSKIPFNLIRNGNQISRGNIVVNQITSTTIECYFLAGNSSWFQDFQFDIQEVDLSDFNDFLAWNTTAIALSMTAPKGYGITYPFVDWIYNRQKNSSILATAIWLQADTTHENNTSDFYPCFYLHTLVEYIFRKTSYKYTGLTETLFNQIVITPPDGDPSHPDILIGRSEIYASLHSSQVVGAGVTTVVNYVRDIGDPNRFDDTSHSYLSMGFYTYEVLLVITTNVTQSYSITGTVNIVSPASSPVVQINSTVSGSYPSSPILPVSINGAAGFTITSAFIQYRIKKSVRPGSLFNPVAIIPSMKAIELIKSVAIRMGYVVNFTEASKTINFTGIENINTYEDWSQYLVSYEYIYREGFKNNYIRTAQGKEFDSYNLTNEPNYGETNLSTPFGVNIDNDLYTDPFGGAKDSIMGASMQWCQPYIPMVNLSDSDAWTITSVSDDGSGYAQLNGSGFDAVQLGLVRVVDDNAYYSGIHIVQSKTSTTIVLGCLYVGNSTGTVYKQSVSFNSPGSRLLVVNNSYPLSNIGAKGDFDLASTLTGTFSSVSNYTSVTYGYFSKPTTGRGVDQLKQSVSYGPINLQGYQDVSLDNRYRRVKRMLSNPIVRCQMLLPEAVFASFNSDKLITVTCKDFSANFWVERILNYKDSKTLVEVDLLFT